MTDQPGRVAGAGSADQPRARPHLHLVEASRLAEAWPDDWPDAPLPEQPPAVRPARRQGALPLALFALVLAWFAGVGMVTTARWCARQLAELLGATVL